MTRVRVVSLRSFDPLIASLSPKAFRAWARAIDWSCFHGTDGLLTPEDVKTIGATPAQVEELISRGVWKLDEDGQTFVAELREGPVFAEVEGCEVEHRALTNAERQKAYRDRQRNTKALRSNVTQSNERYVTDEVQSNVTAVTNPPGSPQTTPDLKSSPNSESSSALSSSSDLTGSARVQRNRRRSALPADWKPTEKHIEMATKNGLNLDRESIRFRSHHEAKGSLMANWNAAFTTWLMNAVEFARPPGAVQHEQRRQEDAGRPYHGAFPRERSEPKATPKEALQAIQGALAGIGRRLPA